MCCSAEAAALTVTAGFTDDDRAEVVFQVGVVRYSQSSIAEAIVLFDQALILAEGPESAPIDCVRTSSTGARVAIGGTATGSPPRKTSSARSSSPRRAPTHAESQTRSSRPRSSLSGRDAGCSRARTPSERARCSRSWGTGNGGSALNNLAGLNHLLGNVVQAIALLEEAFEIFVELDLAVDAGYVCSSLAEIRLTRGVRDDRDAGPEGARPRWAAPTTCRRSGRRSSRWAGRSSGRAGSMAEQWIAAPTRRSSRRDLVSHRSSAWIAQGDVESQRGNDGVAAGLYRRAARALQEADI